MNHWGMSTDRYWFDPIPDRHCLGFRLWAKDPGAISPVAVRRQTVAVMRNDRVIADPATQEAVSRPVLSPENSLPRGENPAARSGRGCSAGWRWNPDSLSGSWVGSYQRPSGLPSLRFACIRSVRDPPGSRRDGGESPTPRQYGTVRWGNREGADHAGDGQRRKKRADRAFWRDVEARLGGASITGWAWRPTQIVPEMVGGKQRKNEGSTRAGGGGVARNNGCSMLTQLLRPG